MPIFEEIKHEQLESTKVQGQIIFIQVQLKIDIHSL